MPRRSASSMTTMPPFMSSAPGPWAMSPSTRNGILWSVPAGQTVSRWASRSSPALPSSSGPKLARTTSPSWCTRPPSDASSAEMNSPMWAIRAASPVGLSSSTSRRRDSTGSIMWRVWRLAPASCPSIGATRQQASRRRSPPRCHRRSAGGPARRPCGRLLPRDSASRRCGRCGTRRPRPRRRTRARRRRRRRSAPLLTASIISAKTSSDDPSNATSSAAPNVSASRMLVEATIAPTRAPRRSSSERIGEPDRTSTASSNAA